MRLDILFDFEFSESHFTELKAKEQNQMLSMNDNEASQEKRGC